MGGKQAEPDQAGAARTRVRLRKSVNAQRPAKPDLLTQNAACQNVQTGDLAKAKELGWEDPADLPQWKQHEMAEAAAADAAMPAMPVLDDLDF